jgi:hypothetical protein
VFSVRYEPVLYKIYMNVFEGLNIISEPWHTELSTDVKDKSIF